MKQLLFTIAFMATAYLQQSLAQDNQTPVPPSQLLTSYYGIKDTLAGSDANSASIQAAARSHKP